MQQTQDLLHQQQQQQHQQQQQQQFQQQYHQQQQQQPQQQPQINFNVNNQGQQNGNFTAATGATAAGAQSTATSPNSTTNSAPQSPVSTGTTVGRTQISGGRFDFEDGGTYCGGWEEGKAHGQGVCTGPKHQGAYSGAWNYGFEVSGVYIWPSGSSFEGQWQNGRRHGLGVETRGRWLYRGEWTSGSKGRYGVRQSATSTAKYEGTWAGGLQDGYGSETYADGGSYQGQWQEGKRHGYGVRTSAPFGLASHYRPKNIQASMTSIRSNEAGNADPAEKRNHRMDEGRGGFVLKASSDVPQARRNSLVEKTKKGLLSGLKLKKQRSTGDLEKRGTAASGSIRSTVSTTSWISTGSSQSAMSNKSVHTDSNASFTVDEEHLDPSITETYMGEWKRDKRDGYGISERSDGLKYEGEWHNNKKHGYGVTTFRDGTKEEGKYKYNVLITSQKKKHLFLIRSAKFRERIEAAVSSAQRASKYALQKADIAISRTATARGKGEMADNVADQAKLDSEIAVMTAKEFAPDFKPSVLERFERIRVRERYRASTDVELGFKSTIINPVINSPQHIQSQPQPNLEQTQTPNKQLSFTHQPQTQQTTASTIRRQSMLQKQSSIDYTASNPNSNNTNSNLYSQQSQQQQLQPNSTNFNTKPTNYQNSNQLIAQKPPSANQMPNNIMPQQQQQHSNYINMQQQQLSPNQQQPGDSGGTPYYGFTFLQDQQQQQQQQQQQLSNPQQNLKQLYNTSNTGHQIGNQTNQQFQQHQQIYNQMDNMHFDNSMQYDQGQKVNLRRNSRPINDGNKPPMMGNYTQPASIDHFSHYQTPPSRDSSVDRYARAASRLSGTVTNNNNNGGGMSSVNNNNSSGNSGGASGMLSNSRQPSVDRTIMNNSNNPIMHDTPDRNIRSGSAVRGTTPIANTSASILTGNGAVMTGRGLPSSRSGTPSYNQQSQAISNVQAIYSNPNQPFEDVLLRQRTLGQDIIPSPRQPNRTESLYVPPKPMIPMGGSGGAGGAGGKSKLKSIPIALPLSRKKSLPDVQELPRATDPMSREEVSALGSARREEVRRQIENSERLKANPLLYLVSPQVKDWFSRQQLVMLVLVINIAFAIMFFKMLT